MVLRLDRAMTRVRAWCIFASLVTNFAYVLALLNAHSRLRADGILHALQAAFFRIPTGVLVSFTALHLSAIYLDVICGVAGNGRKMQALWS